MARYYRVENDSIVAVWPEGTTHIYLADLDIHIDHPDFNTYNVYQATREPYTLADNERLNGFSVSLIGGLPVETANIETLTQQEYDDKLAAWRSKVSVTRYQMKEHMRQIGQYTTVVNYINNAAESDQLYWREVDRIKRSSPYFETMRTTLGYTEEQADTLFRNAKQII